MMMVMVVVVVEVMCFLLDVCLAMVTVQLLIEPDQCSLS